MVVTRTGRAVLVWLERSPDRTQGFLVSVATLPSPVAPTRPRPVPNPFRASTSIELPADATTFEVLDVTGKIIHRGPVTDGVARWDGMGVAPGVYFVRGSAGDGAGPATRVVYLGSAD